KVLMLSIQKHRFAIPMANIEQILSIPVDKILHDSNDSTSKSIVIDNNPVPLIDLRDFLKFSSSNTDSIQEEETGNNSLNQSEHVVLWRKGTRNIGFLVNDLLGERDVVIKPINDFLSQVGTFSGATILEGGQVVLIIDPMNFLETRINA
ncbi:MAG: chemotaxis protein CheW, partial [Candidatus Hodarchaeales archaeon]